MVHKFKSRYIIVAALFLITGMLLAVTIDVYAKNKTYNEISENLYEVQQAKEVAMRNHYIETVKRETSGTTVEKAVEVAAAAVKEAPALVEQEEEVYYEEVYVEETVSSENAASSEEAPVVASTSGEVSTEYANYYSADQLRLLGEIYEGGWRWTWYSQNVLPGGGLTIPGRHVDENGYVCDENDRICLASEDLAYGTVVSTPFGKEGCVYDCGCDYGTLDVYVNF